MCLRLKLIKSLGQPVQTRHIVNADLMGYKEDELEDIRRPMLLTCLRLLAMINTKKGYLIALQNFQPLTEYNQTKEEDAVDAIWHKMNSPLYFKDYGDSTSSNYGYVYGAYKVMNSLDMKLKYSEAKFAIHDFTVFPYVDAERERNTTAIVKQLKGVEFVEENGSYFPVFEVEVFSDTIIPASGVTANGACKISGEITLSGTLKVVDKSSPMTDATISVSKEKTLKAKIDNQITDMLKQTYVVSAKPSTSEVSLNVDYNIGSDGNVSTTKVKTLSYNPFKVEAGTTTSKSSEVNVEKNSLKMTGTMSIDFDVIVEVKDDLDDSEATYSFVPSTVKVAVGVGAFAIGVAIIGFSGGTAAPIGVTLATTGVTLALVES